MILELIIAATTLLTGSTCAGIDNAQNKAVWAGPTTPLTTTHYEDMGAGLVYDAYPPRTNGILALLHAEDALQAGAPGRKIPVRCFTTINNIPHEVGGNGLDHDHV